MQGKLFSVGDIRLHEAISGLWRAEQYTGHRSSSVAKSGVRNLLMEWGVVAFDSTENKYVLAAEYAPFMPVHGAADVLLHQRSYSVIGGTRRILVLPQSRRLSPYE